MKQDQKNILNCNNALKAQAYLFFMSELNFHFTASSLVHNNGSRDFPTELDQTFFRDILERKLNSPNLIFSDYLKIAHHLSPFYKSGQRHIQTNISGLIVPICHGDVNDYFHIAVSIPGDFKRDLEQIWRVHGIHEQHPKDSAILRKRGNLTESFMREVFPIPLFGAYNHIPGYRDVLLDGKEDDKPLEGKLHYVQDAFERWVNENFLAH